MQLFDRVSRASLRSIALLIGALIGFELVAALVAERSWFVEVGYLQVFQVRLAMQAGLALLGFGLGAVLLGGNLAIAKRSGNRIARRCIAPADATLPGRLPFRRLLLATIALSVAIAGLVIFYGQTALQAWHSRPSVALPITLSGVGIAIAVVLLLFGEPALWAIALLLSLACALVLSDQWQTVLLGFHRSAFGRTEPLFGRDLGDYIFQLPLWELITFWLVGLLAIALASVLLVYLRSNDSISQGEFLGFASVQRRHLSAIGGGLMLTVALNDWLDRYRLLYDPGNASYGASYVDVTIQLPVETGLSFLALAIALFLLGRAIAWPRLTVSDRVWSTRQPLPVTTAPRQATSAIATREAARPILRSLQTTAPPKPKLRFNPYISLFSALLLYALIAILFRGLLPLAVQRLVVQPNELLREQPFIERTIAATRNAFELDEIDTQNFDVQDNLTLEAIDRNDLTIRNIRLWDTRPLLQTNRQLQRFRPYYEFPGADIDRYTLSTPAGGEQQQVLIAARELDYTAVPSDAQTWVNEHLVYTHGFGFTLSPVNVAAEGGLPDYLIQGIEHRSSSDRVRNSIPVGIPRIYYGEITNTHIYAPTRVRELDFPSGSDNVYNTYDGQGGIPIAPFWKRLIFANYLRDWQLLFNQDFTPATRVLFRRNIVDRVRAIAPFLQLDGDPYLVAANAEFRESPPDATPNTLYWIIDAYTTSDRYPYSAPGENAFNYIRNSVKVVVDAYHGTVRFFVADEQDPIVQSWSRIFPGMMQPLAELPDSLRAHLRYPQDFYRIQSDQLMLYHMIDPQVFYNREDLWRAPNEIYGSEPQVVQPYYLIMKLPDTVPGALRDRETEEFLLFRPFTPAQRTNLIAWLAARSDISRSDRGDRPGRLILYRFSKQELVFGTEQLEARINQDPVISQQISLWNRQGSRVVQGNLLVIPIENSLLYVEPLYLEAEQNELPTLVRVIVAYGNRIVMAETLQQAIQSVFRSPTTEAPAIVRPVEEGVSN
ncbi:UPF0182 family protein [Microcoleus sp. FACHB-1515]|nr:UPF0182 family protein [Microcoleus sp. FACHB-1515]